MAMVGKIKIDEDGQTGSLELHEISMQSFFGEKFSSRASLLSTRKSCGYK